MGPKIESALRFLRGGGREVIITSYERLLDAVRGDAGTHIVRDERMTRTSFVANVGGLLGLCMGFSLVRSASLLNTIAFGKRCRLLDTASVIRRLEQKVLEMPQILSTPLTLLNFGLKYSH